jgi:hypothetical protein
MNKAPPTFIPDVLEALAFIREINVSLANYYQVPD